MERKTTTQDVPTTDRDVPAVADPKRPWTKPEIRIMKVSFTSFGNATRVGENLPGSNYSPS